jgi:secreted Zn-dependent insulinase-like peptidase
LGFSLLIKNGIYNDPTQILETIKKITIEDFEAFEKCWLSRIFCEWFINGNILEAEALSLVKEFEDFIKSLPDRTIQSLSPGTINPICVCKLEPSRNYIYELKIANFSEKEDRNSAIKMFWQGGRTTLFKKQ